MNNEGFIVLVPNKPDEKCEAKKVEEAHKKIKFKKGSWKSRLWKKLKSIIPRKNVEDFHFVKLTNFIIAYSKDDSAEAKVFNNTLPKSIVKGFGKKYDDSFVLIQCADNMYSKITKKSYNKLAQVKSIAFDYTVKAYVEGDDEYDLVQKDILIDNINNLMSFIDIVRKSKQGHFDYEGIANGWYRYEFKIKTLVHKMDGTVDTYKSFDEFLKNYDIKPI